MSKTVTIPTGGGNPFVVILGGVKYVYKPGETVEVPDGVALEIEEWERWHEKYYGENEPPFGVQPDLSQNDPNAPDYVKNRTHWVREETVLERQTIGGFADIGGGVYVLQLPYALSIPNGTGVTVHWDGIEYGCIAADNFFGNLLFGGGEDSGEPFAVVLEDSATIIATPDTSASHEIGIAVEKPIKLDKKFMPDGFTPYFLVLLKQNESGDGYVLDKTYDEMAAARRNGCEIVVLDVTFSDAELVFRLNTWNRQNQEFFFEYFMLSDGGLTVKPWMQYCKLTVASDNTVEYTSYRSADFTIL